MHQAFSRFTRLPVSLRESAAYPCRPGRTPVGDGQVCCRAEPKQAPTRVIPGGPPPGMEQAGTICRKGRSGGEQNNE